MDNKELKEEKDWFDDLLSAENDPGIGTDENAILAYDMSALEDMELEKIIQEAKSGDWNLTEEDRAFLTSTLPKEEAPAEPVLEEPLLPADEDYGEDTDEEYDEDFDEWEDEEEDEEEEELELPERVPRKVRPKRKNGYGLFGLPRRPTRNGPKRCR